MTRAKEFLRAVLTHRYGLLLAGFVAAAAATGAGCVWFMWGFEAVLDHRLDAARIGAWTWVTTPLLFVAAVETIRRAAPCAAGTGIPQAVFAAGRLEPANEKRLAPLTAPATLAVKVAAHKWGRNATPERITKVHDAFMDAAARRVAERVAREKAEAAANGAALDALDTE